MKMKCFTVASTFLIAVFLTVSSGMPSSTQDDLLNRLSNDCAQKDSLNCYKYKLFSYLDNILGSRNSFALAEGISVVKTETEDSEPPSARSFDGKSDSVESFLVNRFERFLRTHTIKFDMKGSDVLRGVSNIAETFGLLPETVQTGNDVEEGRSKKKKAAKILLPLLLALKLKLATLLPFAIAAIALMAKKALIVGKLALLIAGLIGIKKLFGNQQKSVTYEIVSHPHHSNHDVWSGGDYGSSGNGGGGHGGGWGRSTDDSHRLAYNSYLPQN